jgi:carboxylate-amine ligase
LDERLIDVGAGCSRPAADVVGALLDHVRPVLEERGDYHEVADGISRILRDGNGASRQRQAYARRGELTDIVDMVAEATRP